MKLTLLTSLFHQHYWGIPHKRPGDGRLIVSCYECNAEREVRAELTTESLSPDQAKLPLRQPEAQWRDARSV